MAEHFVTVATFNQSFEAQLAKNLLESEGIEAMTGGEYSSDVLFGNPALGDQIVLQVHEDDAQRATGILATVQAARLEPNWEKQAEAGVWVCSICGEAISNNLSMCYACQTPREGIRADTPRERHAIQPADQAIQNRDDIVDAPSNRSTAVPALPARQRDEDIEEPPLSPIDDMARRAFGATIFGFLTILLLPLSWYYLAEIFFSDDDLSPKGRRYVRWALLINAFFILYAYLMIRLFYLPL